MEHVGRAVAEPAAHVGQAVAEPSALGIPSANHPPNHSNFVDTQARRKDAELIEPSTVRDWFGATQPYVMNIIVANIDSRELRITFVYVWVGTDNPRRSGVFWSPWDDYDAQL